MRIYGWAVWGLFLVGWLGWLFPWGLLTLLWGALSLRDDTDITISILTFITVPTILVVAAVCLAKRRLLGPIATLLIVASMLLLALPVAVPDR